MNRHPHALNHEARDLTTALASGSARIADGPGLAILVE